MLPPAKTLNHATTVHGAVGTKARHSCGICMRNQSQAQPADSAAPKASAGMSCWTDVFKLFTELAEPDDRTKKSIHLCRKFAFFQCGGLHGAEPFIILCCAK